jgi:ribonuclease HII
MSNPILDRFYNEENQYEIALDEAGRGCLFGRVYIACVVLPKDPALFDGTNIKDSKKFSSKKKLYDVAEYIKKHALAWYVSYIDETVIDDINILQAVMKGMHDCINNIIIKIGGFENLNCRSFEKGHSVTLTSKLDVDSSEDVTGQVPLQTFRGMNNGDKNKTMILVDGNYFHPYRRFDKQQNIIKEIPHVTIEQGDGKYMAIAAASILAKTARDQYVKELCEKYPVLCWRYGLEKNMGYGTKQHLDGIREYGITQWHRRTFGELCKNAILSPIGCSEEYKK